MTTAALSLPYSRGRYLLWSHPEWWALLISVAAWLALITGASRGFASLPFALRPHAHSAPDPTVLPHSSLATIFFNAWREFVAHWPLMIAAMMLPLIIGQVRFVAAHSIWQRRNRAIAYFLLGYSALWLVFGFLAELLLRLQNAPAPTVPVYVLSGLFFAAALWQRAPLKRRALLGCHAALPLAPVGWRANLDCLRYGLRIFAACGLSCWILMLACAAAGHTLWVMLVVSFVAWSERSGLYPRQVFRSLLLLAAGMLALIVG